MNSANSEIRTTPPSRQWILALLLLALLTSVGLRIPNREIKPMHVDESTQAVKLRELIDGNYRYDPVDHHGPTLLYATLPVMRALSVKNWNDLTESQLRLVPALFGIGLLALLFLVRDGLRPLELAWGALAVAASPVMVFYSRYYIMEMLLVFFTFAAIGAGWRFFQSRKTIWLAFTGISMGLMHATKETCVLHFAAMGAGLAGLFLIKMVSGTTPIPHLQWIRKNLPNRRQIIVLLTFAAVTSGLIFSQFLTQPRGIWHSIATYGKMIGRAGGQGHEERFLYYLSDILWGSPIYDGPKVTNFQEWIARTAKALPHWREMFGFQSSPRLIVGERVFLILAATGILTALLPLRAGGGEPAKRQLVQFLAVYSVATLVIYSAIAYKTPWCVLGAWHGLLIMAGVGAAALAGLFRHRTIRLLISGLLLLGFAQTGLIAWRVTQDERLAANTKNPYNYSMTAPDCLDWVTKIGHFADLSGKGGEFGILQLDASGGWPLPWYLSRKYPNYLWQGTEGMPLEKIDVILASPEARETLPAEVLGTSFSPGEEPWFAAGMRLHTSSALTVFVRRRLWEAYIAGQPWKDQPLQK